MTSADFMVVPNWESLETKGIHCCGALSLLQMGHGGCLKLVQE